MPNRQLSPRLVTSLIAVGFVLSAALGASFMVLGGEGTVVEAPKESVATAHRVSFELRVVNPAGVSLAEEREALKGLQNYLSQRFPDLAVTDKQTFEGYLVEVVGDIGGNPDSKELAPIYSEVESLSKDYVATHYRAQLIFDKPFNFSVEAVEAVEAERITPARLVTGGAFGVALFSLVVLVMMIVFEGRKIRAVG